VGTADVRQERVEALKQQILDGSYSPDPAAIARRILEDEA
jgi:flagellar biosynthesis anti-sigma factor FlgM